MGESEELDTCIQGEGWDSGAITGCPGEGQEGAVTEKHVLKGEPRLKPGRTEEKRNVTEAKADTEFGGRKLTCPLLLRVQAKLVL